MTICFICSYIYRDSDALSILAIIFILTKENASNVLFFFTNTLPAFGKPRAACSSEATLKRIQ